LNKSERVPEPLEDPPSHCWDRSPLRSAANTSLQRNSP
jgi:hypothetical protein